MALLLRHYGPLLRYVIAPILENPADREECLSEVTMRVWEKISGYDAERGSLSSWLTAVARNAALTRARKNARSAAEPLSEALPSQEEAPEEKLLREERRNELRRAVGSLSLSDRRIFYRKYYYLQSTAQIASELGLSQRAVEGRLYRLRLNLRRMLGGEDRG